MLRIKMLAAFAALMMTGFIGANMDVPKAEAFGHGRGPVRGWIARGVERRQSRRAGRQEARAAAYGSYSGSAGASSYSGSAGTAGYGAYNAGGSAGASGSYSGSAGATGSYSGSAGSSAAQQPVYTQYNSGCQNCGRAWR